MFNFQDFARSGTAPTNSSTRSSFSSSKSSSSKQKNTDLVINEYESNNYQNSENSESAGHTYSSQSSQFSNNAILRGQLYARPKTRSGDGRSELEDLNIALRLSKANGSNLSESKSDQKRHIRTGDNQGQIYSDQDTVNSNELNYSRDESNRSRNSNRYQQQSDQKYINKPSSGNGSSSSRRQNSASSAYTQSGLAVLASVNRSKPQPRAKTPVSLQRRQSRGGTRPIGGDTQSASYTGNTAYDYQTETNTALSPRMAELGAVYGMITATNTNFTNEGTLSQYAFILL
jgi:hypothetical protein